MNILNLSDELLVLIFEYVSGVDKINLFKTCMRFSGILRDRKLIRSLNFAGCYSITISDIKNFIRPKICYKNVKSLDLSSCYWLLSSEICSCVIKLENLNALYVVDTPLTRIHLLQIITALPRLQRLSWTVIPASDEPTEISGDHMNAVSSKLRSFKFLFFYVKTDIFTYDDLMNLYYWLALCDQLEELWLIFPTRPKKCCTNHSYQLEIPEIKLNFPVLHTLVINVLSQRSTEFYLLPLFNMILDACRTERKWKCYWNSVREEFDSLPGWPCGFSEIKTLLVSHSSTEVQQGYSPKLEHLAMATTDLCQHELVPEMQNVKKLLWLPVRVPICWNTLWHSVTNLQELSIQTCVHNIQNIFEQKNLQKLALPICIFRACDTPDSKASTSHNNIRVIVETCPNVEEFELTPCYYCDYSPLHADQESSLLLLAKWKCLRRLKLEGLNCIRSGQPFLQILHSCERLESISLKNLGLRAGCSYLFEFCKALEFCTNLKDFRLEQSNIVSSDYVLKALSGCSKLERICIIVRSEGKPPEKPTLINLVNELPKLVFLYVAVDKFTQSACRDFTKTLLSRFKTSHPGIHVSLLGARARATFYNVKQVPGIHFFEMIEDVSFISSKPGSGKRYLTHN